jgi:hypothetical protein
VPDNRQADVLLPSSVPARLARGRDEADTDGIMMPCDDERSPLLGVNREWARGIDGTADNLISRPWPNELLSMSPQFFTPNPHIS